MNKNTSSKRWLPLTVVGILAGLLSLASQALADGVAAALRLRKPPEVLVTPTNPDEFLADLHLVLPRPVVPLTLEDAVAAEILTQSKSLAEGDALRTAQALLEEADRLGYDPFIFLALMKIESGFDHFAVSPVGAEGLMQIMPKTGEWFAHKEGLNRPEGHTFDPVLNVRLGTRYLVSLHKQFKRMDLALTAYNRGPNATRTILRQFGSLPDSVNEVYAGKVLKRYETLRATYGELPRG